LYGYYSIRKTGYTRQSGSLSISDFDRRLTGSGGGLDSDNDPDPESCHVIGYHIGIVNALSCFMEINTPHLDWKDWFARYGPRLLLFARQQTRTAADAEDVLQNALVRVWRNHGGLAHVGLPLVYKNIRWCAIDHARSEDRRSARESGVLDHDQPLFENPVLPDDAGGALEGVLRQLSAEQREVVTLKIWGDLTFEEIGQSLDISPNTAASRYRYALERMRELLSESKS